MDPEPAYLYTLEVRKMTSRTLQAFRCGWFVLQACLCVQFVLKLYLLSGICAYQYHRMRHLPYFRSRLLLTTWKLVCFNLESSHKSTTSYTQVSNMCLCKILLVSYFMQGMFHSNSILFLFCKRFNVSSNNFLRFQSLQSWRYIVK
jgi:hypothetical protein